VGPEYLLGCMQFVGTIRVLTAFPVRDVVTTQTSRHLGLGSPTLLTLVYNLPQVCCVSENTIQTIITRMTVHD
jgi:branched-subunit amino acid transport protein